MQFLHPKRTASTPYRFDLDEGIEVVNKSNLKILRLSPEPCLCLTRSIALTFTVLNVTSFFLNKETIFFNSEIRSCQSTSLFENIVPAVRKKFVVFPNQFYFKKRWLKWRKVKQIESFLWATNLLWYTNCKTFNVVFKLSLKLNTCFRQGRFWPFTKSVWKFSPM